VGTSPSTPTISPVGLGPPSSGLPKGSITRPMRFSPTIVPQPPRRTSTRSPRPMPSVRPSTIARAASPATAITSPGRRPPAVSMETASPTLSRRPRMSTSWPTTPATRPEVRWSGMVAELGTEHLPQDLEGRLPGEVGVALAPLSDDAGFPSPEGRIGDDRDPGVVGDAGGDELDHVRADPDLEVGRVELVECGPDLIHQHGGLHRQVADEPFHQVEGGPEE